MCLYSSDYGDGDIDNGKKKGYAQEPGSVRRTMNVRVHTYSLSNPSRRTLHPITRFSYPANLLWISSIRVSVQMYSELKEVPEQESFSP